jgi:hypothetical protein
MNFKHMGCKVVDSIGLTQDGTEVRTAAKGFYKRWVNFCQLDDC